MTFSRAFRRYIRWNRRIDAQVEAIMRTVTVEIVSAQGTICG